jgi:hypothetical protein
MQSIAVVIAISFLVLGFATTAKAEVQGSPDVLVLGDSQLSFGAGKAFVDLFDTLRGDCGLSEDTTVGVIGVRSSTLQSWTSNRRSINGVICEVDQKWHVNAGVYGTLAQGDSPYVQIGEGQQFQFCSPERSPLQAVFHDGYYQPQLVVMFLLGNSSERWANSAEAALSDLRSFLAEMPEGQPCIFMTSAPPYGEKTVRLRQIAQDNIEAAFAEAGSQCSFVRGLTPETVAENLGNASNFRRNASGRVKDPYHPTEAAAGVFMALQRDAICMAVAAQLTR